MGETGRTKKGERRCDPGRGLEDAEDCGGDVVTKGGDIRGDEEEGGEEGPQEEVK